MYLSRIKWNPSAIIIFIYLEADDSKGVDAMAERSGGEKSLDSRGQIVPYHVAITNLATRPWEICARLGYGWYGDSGQSTY